MIHFQNWSKSVSFPIHSYAHPDTLKGIVTMVETARAMGRGLRVVGAGHSFTPLVSTNGLLLTLNDYQGLIHVDRERMRVRVRAGTRIDQLGALLAAEGLAQENLGDIDSQSIAGAISTATHGTGLGLGNISSQVTGLTLVLASGEVVTCSETCNRELFKAAQVSLGALGVIVEVELQVVPAFRMHFRWQPEPLATVLESLAERVRSYRNFEFYWLPHSPTALTKTMQPTTAPPDARNWLRSANELVLENGAVWLLSELARLQPPLAPRISRMMATLISSGQAVDWSHKLYATPRLVKFQEMEYALPLENFVAAVQAIDARIRRERHAVHFPLECRFVKGDDIWLSTAYGRETAYIAVHMYQGMAYRSYFQAMEEVLRSYGGRPHWGKMHTLSARELAPLYPRWADWQTVRAQADPSGLFMNDYLRNLMETPAL
jgi:FAD-linked oxidoreductase